MTVPSTPQDGREELEFWRASAETRGKVIRGLHEFNYWHESTVARGEVIAGLEQSVTMWRERCLAAEARLAAARESPARPDPATSARRSGRELAAALANRIRRLRRMVDR